MSRLRSRFGEWSIPARSAALFGSAAREDGDADSDIDLLLIRQDRTDPDDPAWAEQIVQLKADIAAWTGNHTQVYELDVDELTRHIAAGQRIVHEWRSDAITLAGTDVGNLLRELDIARRGANGERAQRAHHRPAGRGGLHVEGAARVRRRSMSLSVRRE